MSQRFRFRTATIYIPLVFVLSIWVIFWFQARFFPVIKTLGVLPREIQGLWGILFSPLLHANISHLYNNTIPAFVLIMTLYFFYRPIFWRVFILGWLLSGLLTWIIGRHGNHIGASGIIYFLVSFIFFKGIMGRNFKLLAVSLAVVFVYGGMIWYVFPIKKGMSWEGHLSGFLVGLFLALLFRKITSQKPQYEWEKPEFSPDEDPFLNHFDEDGNFIEPTDES